MALKTPQQRLDELITAAASVFSRLGFRRTQMADVAREMGVSAGTLYRYVESKEALFDLVVRKAFRVGHTPETALPIPTPEPGAVAQHLLDRFDEIRRTPLLLSAIESPAPEHPAAELTAVIGELYDMLAGNRQGLRLIERSAADRPDLAKIYFENGRAELLSRWERYLAARIADGSFAPVPDISIAARQIMETVSWWAWHRFDDPIWTDYGDELARDSTVALLTRALVTAPEAASSSSTRRSSSATNPRMENP
jgi:AcrR family transcriptional regulator